MNTYFANSDNVTPKWYLVDADGEILGRLASQIAKCLSGKLNPEYTPHWDAGDYVVVINAEKITVTGQKESDKIYYRHSEYPGGIKATPLNKMRQKKPEDIIKIAVKGMLPKNSLGRTMLSKLKIYKGTEHPHTAQQPETINLVK